MDVYEKQIETAINSMGTKPTIHLLALSGGKDSTALALGLKEREPNLDVTYYCTPTGDELPEMFDWWNKLGQLLGKRILPIMEMTLDSCIEENNALPNFRQRFCTRQIKIEPAMRYMQRLADRGPIVHYVGLRADEETRLGGVYDSISEVTNRFPLREWGWGLAEVLSCIDRHGLTGCLPERTDCALCYHQRLGEWYRLWKNHPERFAKGVAIEERHGHTFRDRKSVV